MFFIVIILVIKECFSFVINLHVVMCHVSWQIGLGNHSDFGSGKIQETFWREPCFVKTLACITVNSLLDDLTDNYTCTCHIAKGLLDLIVAIIATYRVFKYPRYNNKTSGILTWRALTLLDILFANIINLPKYFSFQKNQQHPLMENGGQDSNSVNCSNIAFNCEKSNI